MLHIPNWINGQDSSGASRLTVINPANETPLATIEATPREQVEAIITDSLHNFHHSPWTQSDASQRFTVLSTAASLLRDAIPELTELEVRQTGRPIREMRAQLSRIPEWLEYFASLARTYEGAVTPFKGPVVNTLTRRPLGVVVQLTPWNHPLLISVKKVAAALAAGNVVILKPSELAPLSVLRLGPLFKQAGLPDGVLQIVCGTGRETGRFLVEDKRIARIDLTGSLATYQALAPIAGRNLVPITAELGGKAPVCVFPSVPVEEAVQAALFAAFIASGQTCVTGSRILVHADGYDAFLARLVERTKALRIGDPMDSHTQVGAVINAAAVRRCEEFVSRAVAQGGRLLCGGNQYQTESFSGFFFAPTLIETVPGTELACTEVFGPVIAVIKCASEEEIIKIANHDTQLALGASVWTHDFAQAHRVAEAIEAGIVWVNGHHLNDPSSPWGGFGESGLGKENGRAAYESYTRLKSTVFNYGVLPVWFDEEGARYG
ncbi:hypothetical protein ASPZODRAFT_137233 [Penicilliopsis zonata CBS 506.65]|uniref:aldehyde dehydrogenase (NAD(+)) n=1 Tax=Penicilliopsis zonata CBS 506.65 TaxID=1073090 RepID=A0A1L9S625_9EURO|nr:hypothetical protein ASPZODRAFT_137233 [Penicilliopsis zonata CBS 506.65]OJJ42628.1 hypothetical protein ASPZODRAFT_137233 [Penicilliopsis zonata CBS 506.65]